MMLFCSLILVLCVFEIRAVEQNVTCPIIAPRELDLKELDGKWFLISIATDMSIQGDCATVTFGHKQDNTTDISISWINNHTASFYNGSVALSSDPNSNTTEGDLLTVTYTESSNKSYYSFLTLDYEHFAVALACTDNDDGNSSTYELWELSRTPHVKPKHQGKINDTLSSYNIGGAPLMQFTNSEEGCKVNSGEGINSSTLVLTSAAALALFRKLF